MQRDPLGLVQPRQEIMHGRRAGHVVSPPSPRLPNGTRKRTLSAQAINDPASNYLRLADGVSRHMPLDPLHIRCKQLAAPEKARQETGVVGRPAAQCLRRDAGRTAIGVDGGEELVKIVHGAIVPNDTLRGKCQMPGCQKIFCRVYRAIWQYRFGPPCRFQWHFVPLSTFMVDV